MVRATLALLGCLGVALFTAWLQPGSSLPTRWQLPQPAGALPAVGLLLPLIAAGAGLATVRVFGAWTLPFLMAALLIGGLPMLSAFDPYDLAFSPSALTALALPVLAAPFSVTALRRLRIGSRVRTWRDAAVVAALAGLVAPALAALLAGGAQWLAGAAPLAAASEAASLGAAWALGLLSTAAALVAAPPPGRRGSPALTGLLAAGALAAQVALSFFPQPAWLLAPQLLLCLHALQASPRHNALLGGALLTLWALGATTSLTSGALGLSLALLPLLLIALALHQQRDRDSWRSALDGQGLALAEWRLPRGGQRASARWLALTTAPGEAAASASSQASPLDWVRLLHPRDRERVRGQVRRLLTERSDDRLSLELRLASDGGDWCWHELQAHVPQRNRHGLARNLIATLTDVSWRHTAAERERLTAALFQHVSEGLAVVDAQGRIVEVNPAYCALLRVPREALIGRGATPLGTATLRSNGHEPTEVQSRLTAGHPWMGQVQATLDDGSHRTFAVKLSPVPEPDQASSPRWRVLSVNDLSDTLRQQELLRRTLRYDTATGLPNRDEFIRQLHQAQIASVREGFRLVVCMVDLDDFARVNAEHGQLVADAVLLQLSGRLQATLRGARGARSAQGGREARQASSSNGGDRAAPDAADQLARLHGDEFAVMLRVQTPEEGQRAVERLLAVLTMPVAIRESQVGDGLALEIGASVGATLFPADDADPETLLRHAGHALYRAKHAGRGGIQFHDPALSHQDELGLIALARVQQALDANELLLHYQPQIDLRTGQVMGVEALLRWRHPERGLLSPMHFLPQIDSTGLAVQIGDWVIEQALAQSAAWMQVGVNGGTGLPVSVNVGARQLRQPDFPQRLQELIQRQPPDVAALLHLDVLEADALAETDATQALIQRCLSLGVGIALDDFGAGYSRLASLKRLPVDTLKLDRSYVQGMLGDAQDLSLVESVVGLGRNIGCAVLAKGVESRGHARELLRVGCRLGQGNAIAAAMAPEALPGWIDGFAFGDWAGQWRAPPVQAGP